MRSSIIGVHTHTGIFMVLHSALTGLVLSTSLLAADPAAADLSVEVVAARHILPVGGWSAVETYVTNTGQAPAADVVVTTVLPAELRPGTMESTSNWECDWAIP